MNPFILKTPVITEKSYRLAAEKVYTFYVAPAATKGQIKEAVESTFNVKVLDVHTTMVRGKVKKTGRARSMTKTPDRKKAVVRIAKDQSIDIFDIQE